MLGMAARVELKIDLFSGVGVMGVRK